MVEKIRFEGIHDEVIVDLEDSHPSHDAARYAFDQHRAIISLVSDDGLSTSEVLGKLGEHRVSCDDFEIESKESQDKAY